MYPRVIFGSLISTEELVWGGYKQWFWKFCLCIMWQVGEVDNKEIGGWKTKEAKSNEQGTTKFRVQAGEVGKAEK